MEITFDFSTHPETVYKVVNLLTKSRPPDGFFSSYTALLDSLMTFMNAIQHLKA